MATPVAGPSALGVGVRTFTGAGTSTSAVVPPTDSNTTKANGGVRSIIDVTTSIEELLTVLGISAQASTTYSGLTVSGKMDLVSRANISSTSVVIAVNVTNSLGTQTYSNAAFKDGIDTNHRGKAFYTSYGDSYVNSVTTGSQYIALYTFYATNVEAQRALRAELEAALEGTLSASAQTTIDEFVATSNTVWTLTQDVYGVSGLQLPPADGVIDFGLKFPTQQVNASAILSYTQAPYEQLPPPKDTTNFPWAPDSELPKNRSTFTNTVSGQIADLALISNGFDELQELYDTYAYTDATIATPLATLKTDLDSASKYVKDVDLDPTVAVAAPEFKTLQSAKPVPTPSFSLQYSGPIAKLNDKSSTPFNSPVTLDSIAARTVPTKITLGGFAHNDQSVCTWLEVEYTAKNQTPRSYAWGGIAESKSTPLTLQGGELIKQIGASDKGVFGFAPLTFTTTRDTSVSFGSSIGTINTWKSAGNGTFVGVTGWTGTYAQFFPIANIAQLSAQYVVFAPAIFVALPRRRPEAEEDAA